MWEWITGIAYYAHGYCLSWDPWLIGLHAGSDFLIFGAYTAIPLAILMFVRKRQSLELKGLARFFAAFIFWCGLTHLFSMITLWFPLYDIQALIKSGTAVISVVTAGLVFKLLPKALAIPSPRELQLANSKLQEEIAAHEVTLRELTDIRDNLERKVQERTRELEAAARHADGLTREVAHRTGNLMSVIGAMARQSFNMQASPANFIQSLIGRIDGMGRSHKLLFQKTWQDVELADVIRSQLSGIVGDQKLELSGPRVLVSPAAVHNLGLSLHELASSANDRGTLTHPDARVVITWVVRGNADGDQVLELTWQESGTAADATDVLNGWSATVLTSITASALHGVAELEAGATGLQWKLKAPIRHGILGARSEPQTAAG